MLLTTVLLISSSPVFLVFVNAAVLAFSAVLPVAFSDVVVNRSFAASVTV